MIISLGEVDRAALGDDAALDLMFILDKIFNIQNVTYNWRKIHFLHGLTVQKCYKYQGWQSAKKSADSDSGFFSEFIASRIPD